MDAYIPILNALLAAKIEQIDFGFAIIGTYALKHYYPVQMGDYALEDCDLMLNPNLGNIQKAVEVLLENGWRLTLWEKEVIADVEWAELEGKFYLRATKGSLRLDLTYECPGIPWTALERAINTENGLPFAAIEHIKKLKEIKGSPKDIAVLKLL